MHGSCMHLRKAVDRPAKIYFAGDQGVVCRIRDISKGGAKIRIAWTGWLPDSFDLAGQLHAG